MTDESLWEAEDRKREEHILFVLGNDESARLWWEWLGEEAERRGYENIPKADQV